MQETAKTIEVLNILQLLIYHFQLIAIQELCLTYLILVIALCLQVFLNVFSLFLQTLSKSCHLIVQYLSLITFKQVIFFKIYFSLSHHEGLLVSDYKLWKAHEIHHFHLVYTNHFEYLYIICLLKYNKKIVNKSFMYICQSSCLLNQICSQEGYLHIHQYLQTFKYLSF